MTRQSQTCETAFDPFGEPMGVLPAWSSARAPDVPGRYRETRRAALVFWALAALLVGGRIYFADPSVPHATIVEAAPAPVEVAALR